MVVVVVVVVVATFAHRHRHRHWPCVGLSLACGSQLARSLCRSCSSPPFKPPNSQWSSTERGAANPKKNCVSLNAFSRVVVNTHTHSLWCECESVPRTAAAAAASCTCSRSPSDTLDQLLFSCSSFPLSLSLFIAHL